MTANDVLVWLMETSLAVSALVALVLLVRRKAAALFGAEAAYLLWLAPLVRLGLPDLPVLPSALQAAPAARSAADGPLLFAGEFAAVAPAPDFSGGILFAFAAGAVLFLLFQLHAQRRFMAAMLTNSASPSAALSAEAAACARRLGLRRMPAVRIAATRAGPLVAGVLRPVIILPSGFAEDFARRERDLVFAHELTHVRRGDLVFAFAALLFRALQWPNPLAHVAFRAFRIDQEAACDADVIAANGAAPDISYAYGAALVKSAAHVPAAPAASLAMSSHLKERLMRLKHCARLSLATARAAAGAFIAAALALSASYSAAAATAPEDAEAPKAKKTVRQIEVLRLDADETLAPDGAPEAHRVEIEDKDGVPTVRAYDAEGKLLFERPMKDAPADRKVMIIRKKGDEKSAAGDAPDVFAWEGDDGEGGALSRRKIIVMEPGEDGAAHFAGDCQNDGSGAMVFSESDEESDKPGERRVMTQVICLDGEAGADPAKRADALRQAIARIEDSAKREAAQREKMIGKLKEELAKAEREAKKKK